MSSSVNRITSNPEDEGSNQFALMPAELIRQVLTNVTNVKDLQSCRLVCQQWNILAGELLSNEIRCTVYKGQKFSPKQLASYKIKAIRGPKLVFETNHLRISHIHTKLESHMLKNWIRTIQTENFRTLEFNSVRMSFYDMMKVQANFNNVASLSLMNVCLTGDDIYPRIGNQVQFKNLRELKFRMRNSVRWFMTRHFLNLVFQACRNLETLVAYLPDTGNPRLDNADLQYRHHLSLIICCIIRCSTTLAELNIITYEFQEARKTNYMIYQKSDLPQMQSQTFFDLFLKEISRHDWRLVDFPTLTTLRLGFRLANLDVNPRYWFSFLPLIGQMHQLRYFEFNQIYQEFYGHNSLSDLLGIIPESCKIRIGRLTRLMHDARLNVCLAQLNTEARRFHKRQFDKNPAIRPNPRFRIQDGFERADGQLDSIVEIQYYHINITNYFVDWTAFDQIPYIGRNIYHITKINIQQIGLLRLDKMIVSDGIIQMLIQNASSLKELMIEDCNLSQVSDYGFTGLRFDARSRIRDCVDPKLKPEDYLGLPISHLSNLRVMRLSNIGWGVTEISMRFGFEGMCLANFTLNGELVSKFCAMSSARLIAN